MPIYCRVGGVWRLVDNVHHYGTPAGQRRRVIAAYLYQSNLTADPPVHYGVQKVPFGTTTRHKLFDFSAAPPAVTGLVGTSPVSTDPNHHSRAILNWNPMPGAVSYKIHRYEPVTTTGTTTAERNAVDVVPSPATATTYTFSGLAVPVPTDTTTTRTYCFRVTYFNEFGIESVPRTITLKTGKAAVVAKSLSYPSNPPADKYQALPASSSDTWTKAKQWGNAYQVTQGYLSSVNDRGYGCINYANGYANVAAGLDALYGKTYGAGIGAAILDQVALGTTASIVDATFSRWTQLAGCSAGNNVYIYPAKFSYSSGATAPVSVGSSAYFDAPGPGVMKHNFRTIDGDGDNSHLILWAKNLVMKSPTIHNGLMIYRGDTTNTSGEGYAGYAKFQSKSDPNDTTYDLRINVWVKFSFTFKPYVAPVWS